VRPIVLSGKRLKRSGEPAEEPARKARMVLKNDAAQR
jgi:hypothetical protein